MSLGLVHRTIEWLRQERYVSGTRGEERVQDRNALLRAFARGYDWEQVTRIDPFFTLDPPMEFRRRLSEWARRREVPLGFTLGSGLRPAEETVPASVTAFYCGAPPATVARELSLSPVPSGPNVLVLSPPPRAATAAGGVYHAPRKLPWGTGVSTVQLYIDLWSQKGRNRDQAEGLLPVKGSA